MRWSFVRVIAILLLVLTTPLASASNLWTVEERNPLPLVLADTASAVSPLDRNLYIIGGFSNNGTDARGMTLRYNATADSWTALANMTTPRWASAAAAVLDRIYVFSGFNAAQVGTNVAEYYNITANSWTSVSATPFLITGGGDCAATYSTDWIFILRQNELYRYSVSLDTYTEMAPLSAPNDMGTFMSCGIVGDFFYALGGTTLKANINRYSIVGNSWTQPYDTNPYVRYGGLPNVVRDGLIYYGYGFDNTNFFSSMFSYDPNTKVFAALPSGNHPRDGVGAGFVGNSIIVVGGRNKVPAFGLDYVEAFTLSAIPDQTPGNLEIISVFLILWVIFLLIGYVRYGPLLFLAAFVGVELAFQIFTRYGDPIVPVVLAVVNVLIVAYAVGDLMDARRSPA